MSVTVKVSADVSGFEGGMARASNALGRLVESEKKLERSIKGLASDLAGATSPADLLTRAFFRMENALAVSTAGAVGIAAALYVFNDFKKYAANIEAVTNALKGMEKARAQAGFTQGQMEEASARDLMGKLGNFGPGAAFMEGLSKTGLVDSPLQNEIALYKRLQNEINLARSAETVRQQDMANAVKQEIEMLRLAEKGGPIEAMRFGMIIKINDAKNAGNNLLAAELQKLMDIKTAQMEVAEQRKRGLELEKNMAAEVEQFRTRQAQTQDFTQANNQRIIDRERSRLPILDQIEAKTQDIEAMRRKLADASGLDAEKIRSQIIGEEDRLQSLLDSAAKSGQVSTSRSSVIADSLQRVGGGGGVFSSGPQMSFTKISSNTDELVRLARSINERVGANTVAAATYQ